MTANMLRDNPALRPLKIIVFTLAGTALMVGAACWAVSTHRFITRAASKPGLVIRLNAGGAHPEIRLTTAAGKAIEYPQGGMIWGYRVRERVGNYDQYFI